MTVRERTEKLIAAHLDEPHRLLFEWLLEALRGDVEEAKAAVVTIDPPLETKADVVEEPKIPPMAALRSPCVVETQAEARERKNHPAVDQPKHNGKTHYASPEDKMEALWKVHENINDVQVRMGHPAPKTAEIRRVLRERGYEIPEPRQANHNPAPKGEFDLKARVIELYERHGNVNKAISHITLKRRPTSEEARVILREAGFDVSDARRSPESHAPVTESQESEVVETQKSEQHWHDQRQKQLEEAFTPLPEADEVVWPNGLRTGPYSVRSVIEGLAEGHTNERVTSDYNVPLEQVEFIKDHFRVQIRKAAVLTERVPRQLYLNALLTRLREAHAEATGSTTRLAS